VISGFERMMKDCGSGAKPLSMNTSLRRIFRDFVAYRAAGNPDPVASIVITTWRSIA
jgi:hypothetical protein